MSATEREPVLLYVSPVTEDVASPRAIRFAEKDERLLQAAVPIDCAYRCAEGFPIFASWVRSYFAFCALRAVRPFPAQGRIVIQRSSVSRAGLTFSNYVSYVKMVCFFLNEALARDTPSVRNVAKALELSVKSNFRFPSFRRIPQAISILHHECAKAEFGLRAYVAYLFPLRVPSEALPLRRAFSND